MTDLHEQPVSSDAPRVAVIVLNWNGKALTLDSVQSLLEVRTPNV